MRRVASSLSSSIVYLAFPACLEASCEGACREVPPYPYPSGDEACLDNNSSSNSSSSSSKTAAKIAAKIAAAGTRTRQKNNNDRRR